mmetsp:Transcript_22826/g.65849  ORF Transcript_22826/g.65849 Transcript_22826/m.65849 type:complete len:107 (+) Transcript_22826:344-664(+)
MEGESGSGGRAQRSRQPSEKAAANTAAKTAVVSSRKKRSQTGNRGADGTAAAGRSKGRRRGSKKTVSPPPGSPSAPWLRSTAPEGPSCPFQATDEHLPDPEDGRRS